MANPKTRAWYGLSAVSGEDALGAVAARATAALPQTDTDVLFSVSGGAVLLLSIVGEVTTAVGNVANNTKIVFESTDLCAVLDIDNDGIGVTYSITGTFANAMIETAVDVPLAIQATGVRLPVGDIILNCAGSDGGDGRVAWTAIYVPLEAAAALAAA